MRVTKNILILVILLLLSLIVGCGASPVRHSESASYGSASQDRLITKSATITIEFKGINTIESKIQNIVNEKKGYIVNSRINSKNRYYATIKVPAETLNESLKLISSLGDEVDRGVSTADVTELYYDNKADLKNSISLRDRLRSLLDKAKEVSEIIAIEEQLTRVQTRIDKMQGRQNLLNDQISYSIISITAEEKRIYGPVGYLVVGVWWVIEKLFIIK